MTALEDTVYLSHSNSVVTEILAIVIVDFNIERLPNIP